jgi:hypothetical protein
MRIAFSELFDVRNGAVSPKVPVSIGGVQMGPGVSFGSGVSFGGVDLASHIGKYLEVEQHGGMFLITGVYPF